jgi:hypothetical protein
VGTSLLQFCRCSSYMLVSKLITNVGGEILI